MALRRFLPLLAGLILVSSLAAANGNARWFHNPEQAFAAARQSNRPVMVDFYADWCGYCKYLHRKVYPSRQVRKESRDFVLLKVNGEKNPDFMRRLGAKGFPSIVFLDKNGYVLGRVNGLIQSDELARKLREARTHAKLEANLLNTLKRNPHSVMANYRTGIYYYEIGRLDHARKYFAAAWTAHGKDAPARKRDALYNAALSSMELKDYTAAVLYWDTYLAAYSKPNSDYAYARLFRGLSNKELGRRNLAVPDLVYAGRNLPSARDRKRALVALRDIRG